MYHTSIENQVFSIKKSQSLKGFSHKDLQTYIATLTPFEQDIANFILQFRFAPWTIILNETIANKVGCSVRTVIRATNKFHEDGFITKQKPKPYDMNCYAFDEKVKKGIEAFSYWFNTLPSDTQDTYISHGIIIDHKNKKICSDVTPNLSTLLLDNLFINSSPSCARTRERRQDFSKKIKGKKMDSEKKVSSRSTERIFKELPQKKAVSLLALREQREQLLQKIDNCTLKIVDPHKYIKFGVIEASVKYFHKELQEYLKELDELEGRIDEKQNVSYEDKSYTMAAYTS